MNELNRKIIAQELNLIELLLIDASKLSSDGGPAALRSLVAQLQDVGKRIMKEHIMESHEMAGEVWDAVKDA
jgi:hypothetical protein